MKTLDELGISPAPWKVVEEFGDLTVRGIEYDGEYGKVSRVILTPNKWDSDETKKANTTMASAAPELYECLREEVEAQQCGSDCKTCINRKDCWVAKAKAALAKAAGEDNNNNNKKGK